MDNEKKYNKVICIGMHKTGTSTLGMALLELGFSVVGARTDLAEVLLKGEIDIAIEEARPYSALQDVPWALLYKELDKKYPNSKFILTEREENKWLNSVLNHFGKTYIPIHEWIYGEGVAFGNEGIYLKKYKDHYAEVKQYFRDRPNDILMISFSNGDDWEKICNFLGHEIPKVKFPYANKGKHNMSSFEKIYNSLRSLIPVSLRRKILNIFGFPDKRNRFNNHFQNKKYRKVVKKSLKK